MAKKLVVNDFWLVVIGLVTKLRQNSRLHHRKVYTYSKLYILACYTS